ncbi:MAG TPA: hypothetical protein VLC54_01545 [Anaeromyxobacter sp.]|nr:hypothetical protein [Anaeromyxobacter sp.]
MIRESVFVCSCRLNETVRVAHVRAWDEDEATEIFVHEMNDEGILDGSDIRVRSLSSARSRAPVTELRRGSSIGEPGTSEESTPGP